MRARGGLLLLVLSLMTPMAVFPAAEVNARTAQGETALILAAAQGHEPMVRMLLEKGADIRARSQTGVTALQAAKSGLHVDVVQLLEKAGANK